MFETVLGRLQALAQAEGFDPQPGTVINGELRAYAAGIALVYDQLTDAREGAYAATAAGENLWRWLTVRGLLPGDTLQETRQKLCGTGFRPFSMPICRAAGAPGMRWTQTRCLMPSLTGQRCPLIF